MLSAPAHCPELCVTVCLTTALPFPFYTWANRLGWYQSIGPAGRKQQFHLNIRKVEIQAFFVRKLWPCNGCLLFCVFYFCITHVAGDWSNWQNINPCCAKTNNLSTLTLMNFNIINSGLFPTSVVHKRNKYFYKKLKLAYWFHRSWIAQFLQFAVTGRFVVITPEERITERRRRNRSL